MGHNLTSEWDFLYNKAHNEYLNYLATTGLFGLGSYLLFIGVFLVWFVSRVKYQVSGKNKTMTASIATLPSLNHSDPVARSLANLERYVSAAVDCPTPILPDTEIEYWAQRYELYGLRERGLRFILFLQSPLYWLRRC